MDYETCLEILVDIMLCRCADAFHVSALVRCGGRTLAQLVEKLGNNTDADPSTRRTKGSDNCAGYEMQPEICTINASLRCIRINLTYLHIDLESSSYFLCSLELSIFV